MGAYPTSPREAFLQWCQDHTEVFTTQAENIGQVTPRTGDAGRTGRC